MLPVKYCFWLGSWRAIGRFGASIQQFFFGGGGSYLHDCCRESEVYCNTYGGWQGSERICSHLCPSVSSPNMFLGIVFQIKIIPQKWSNIWHAMLIILFPFKSVLQFLAIALHNFQKYSVWKKKKIHQKWAWRHSSTGMTPADPPAKAQQSPLQV